jgi:PAS domain S-box-containing protein
LTWADHLFEINETLSSLTDQFRGIRSIAVNEMAYKVLSTYDMLVQRQDDIIREFRSYKERELDAFLLGDAISDGVCLISAEGVVINVNKSYVQITGVRESDLLGKKLRDFTDKNAVIADVAIKALESKSNKSALSVLDKGSKRLLITATPFLDENQGVRAVFTVVRDLTEITNLKEELEKAEHESEKYLSQLNYFRSRGLNSSNLIGESEQIKRLKELISHVAKTDASILITGETGSGKEVVANEIHQNSSRKFSPYVKVNCAAIPETLLESELFGYEKGAFTGAQNKGKIGLFEMANNGTILLDEISEMPLNLQPKLLRVLQEKELTRVGGGGKPVRLNVRVIASTNRDLTMLVREGKFREDLFYRLNVVPIRIPPLRERRDDIALLAGNFLEAFNIKYGKNKYFDASAIKALETYSWPGNVRELKNLIERLTVIDDERAISYEVLAAVIGRSKIPTPVPDQAVSMKEAVEELEKRMIEDALRKTNSTYKAAALLGVTQPTVFRKARAYGIEPYCGESQT